MLAYVYKRPRQFALEEKPLPELQSERDAIVRVTLASVCTSDLHIKHGSVPRAVPGVPVGPEMVALPSTWRPFAEVAFFAKTVL